MTGGPPASAVSFAAEDRADTRLIEHAHRGVAHVAPFDHLLVPVIDVLIVVEGAAAFVQPGAGYRGYCACRVHVGGPVARPAEAVAEAEKRALALAREAREGLDGRGRAAGDGGRPMRVARAQMLLELARRIRVAIEIVPVRPAIAEQAMHDRAGQRAVGAGPDQHRQIGLLHGGIHVDVDGDELCAALLAGAHRVLHHVDLGAGGIGAPDHHQVGLRHLARVGSCDPPGTGGKPAEGGIDADARMEAGIFLGVAQAVDAVAHDEAHGACIVIGPDRLRAVALVRALEALGDQIERRVPGDGNELTRSFRAPAQERHGQAIGMVRPLGVAGDLGADHARGVAVVLRATHAADGALVDDLHLERAGGGTIVRTGRGAHADRRGPGANNLIHGEGIFLSERSLIAASGWYKTITRRSGAFLDLLPRGAGDEG